MVSFLVADVQAPEPPLKLLSSGALMISTGFVCDELRKLLAAGGAAPGAHARLRFPYRLYYAAIAVTVLIVAGWLLRTFASYLFATTDLQRGRYLFYGLEMVLPLICAISLVKLSWLYCGALASIPPGPAVMPRSQ